jgi:lipid II:glycine glycyltransferase (peptidoglycan interpeptide bridge formation enzyme)
VNTWNSLISKLPDPQLLQTWEWGQLKAHYGWRVETITWGSHAAALVLKRSLPVRGMAAKMNILYVPRGPLLDWSNAGLRQAVLADLAKLAARSNAIFIKVDPFVPIQTGVPGAASSSGAHPGSQLASDLARAGWVPSPEQVQFRNTMLLDLSPGLDELMGRMKPKARYNIRLAEKKGVTVRQAAAQDFSRLYRMYAQTSLRDHFTIRDEAYYQRAWNGFRMADGETAPDCPVIDPLVAEVDGQPVAGIVVYRFGGAAWYLFGMSAGEHREKMPNHLLQWEAIRRAKAAGCTRYDLWGAPDTFDETDPMWGVYRFKESLGAQVVRTPGAWDLPVRPTLYRLYTQTLPRLLGWMRSRGRKQTQSVLERG